MDSITIIAVVSIITAGLTIALGSIGPALGEGRAVSTALSSLAQQPDASATITRTLFVGCRKSGGCPHGIGQCVEPAGHFPGCSCSPARPRSCSPAARSWARCGLRPHGRIPAPAAEEQQARHRVVAARSGPRTCHCVSTGRELRACDYPRPWCIYIAVSLNLSQFDCPA